MDIDNEKFKNEIFKVNNIIFKGRSIAICMQSENGPCPLIALLNILLLEHKIEVEGDKEFYTGLEMVNYVGNYIISKAEETGGDLEVILSHFQQLQTGLIVDVCFSSVTAFKDDTSLYIFKFLDIKLYHGWLMDPQNTPDYDRLVKYSYDELTEELVNDEGVLPSSTKTLLRDFVQSSQLTYHGLCQLNETMADNELAVLFHNNHFSVIFKNKEVYGLCTDIGYSGEPGAVWHLLNSTSGDTDFVNDKFEPRHSYTGDGDQERDLELAKKLALADDYEIAKAYQEEEDMINQQSGASFSQSSTAREVTTPPMEKSKESSCVIL